MLASRDDLTFCSQTVLYLASSFLYLVLTVSSLLLLLSLLLSMLVSVVEREMESMDLVEEGGGGESLPKK